MVFIGDQYGLNHCPTYGDREYDQDKHDDPLIEFYDMDSRAAELMRGSDDRLKPIWLKSMVSLSAATICQHNSKMRDPAGRGRCFDRLVKARWPQS